MPRLMLLLIASTFACAANADGRFWFTPGAISYHSKRNADHNERNGGLGLEYVWPQHHALMIGGYNNSNRNRTYYLLYRYTPWNMGMVKLGGCVGVVTGYEDDEDKPTPGAALVATIEGKHVGGNLLATPRGGNAGGLVIAAQIKFRF